MQSWHSKIERNIFVLLVLSLIVTSIGAIVQIFPLFIEEVTIEKIEGMRPYTPLELAGYNIYIREGCYGCHSQHVRTLRDEVERYGHYSLAAESIYDFPFQWGSKRTGPDLARVGNKYSDDWQVQHLINPRSLVPESIMPGYPHLTKRKLDVEEIQQRMKIQQYIGVPYSQEDIEKFKGDIDIQLTLIDDTAEIESFNQRYPNTFIRKFNREQEDITEMDALVAYLQGLGNKVDFSTNKGRNW